MIDETKKKLKSYRIPTRTGFIINANINGSGLNRSNYISIAKGQVFSLKHECGDVILIDAKNNYSKF